MTIEATLLKDDVTRRESDSELLQLIQTSGERSLKLVDELLQMNIKAEELNKESVDIALLLSYCTEMLEHKAQFKNQQLELHAAHVTVMINQEKMWRVISNLIANAIKFSPRNTKIIITAEDAIGKIRIAVKDEGIGIPDAISQQIFHLFTTAQRKGTLGEESYGLGLGISRYRRGK